MTLGQEFHGYSTTLGEDIARLRETIKLLTEVNLGGTAIGTGITADPGYAAAVRATSARSPASRSRPRPTSSRRRATPACS